MNHFVVNGSKRLELLQGSERRFDRLPSLVFSVRFLAIEVEGFQNRSIRKRKQDRPLATRTVGVIVPDPRRKTKDISRRPVEALPVNHRPAASLHDMVDRRFPCGDAFLFAHRAAASESSNRWSASPDHR